MEQRSKSNRNELKVERRCEMSRNMHCLTLFVLATLGGGCLPPRTSPQVYLSKAKGEILAGDYEGALSSLELSLRAKPTAEAYYLLALVKVKANGDRTSAMRYLINSLKLKPTARAYALKAALLEKTDPELALREYRLALRFADGEMKARIERDLGVLLAKRGEWVRSYAFFKSYIEYAEQNGLKVSDPDYAFWGLLLYREGKKSEAVLAWSRLADDSLRKRLLRVISELPPPELLSKWVNQSKEER